MGRFFRAAFIAAAWACLCALLALRLGRFPGLHCDEAWAGMQAISFARSGLPSIHGMNSYTGALGPWLLSRVFILFPPGVVSLRLPGVALNCGSFLLLAWVLARRFSPGSSAAFLALLSSSALFVFEGRLAWEVTALQPFLLAGVIVSALAFLRGGCRSGAWAAVFLCSNFLGIYNHFIFLAVPLSLAFAAVLDRRPSFQPLFAANLFMAGVLFLAKPRVSDGLWAAHPAAVLCSAPLLICLAWGLWRFLAGSRLPGLLKERLERGRPWLVRALAAGLALALALHGPAFLGTWSNVLLFKRACSWEPPLALCAVLYLWAALTLGAFFEWARGVLSSEDALGPEESFLLLWTLALFAVLPVFVTRNCIRYYLMPSELLFFSMAALLRRWIAPWGGRAVGVFAAGALLSIGLFAREIARGDNRRIFDFVAGWHHETSSSFVKLDALVPLLQRSGLCRIESSSSFLRLPLEFYARAARVRCDPSRALAIEYDWSGSGEPYRFRIISKGG